MTNDNVYKTIKQIELTKRAFKMLDDLNRVANNSLILTEQLINYHMMNVSKFWLDVKIYQYQQNMNLLIN